MTIKIVKLSAPLSRLLLLILIVATSSCARKITFGTSTVVPAAEGTIKIKKDHNGNNQVDIDIKNLAEPKRLVPAKETYVVWIETNDNGVKNIGQLKSSTGLFSKSLRGSLHTVTTFKPRRVFITAEDDATIQFPGAQVVLSTDNF